MLNVLKINQKKKNKKNKKTNALNGNCEKENKIVLCWNRRKKKALNGNSVKKKTKECYSEH